MYVAVVVGVRRLEVGAKDQVYANKIVFYRDTELKAKPQNNRPLICISLNKNSDYCYIPRSSKHTNTCK